MVRPMTPRCPVRPVLVAAAVAAVAVAVTAGCANGAAPPERGAAAVAPTARVDRFDGDRAMRHLRAQVRLGPRPAGSPASRKLAQRLRGQLPNGRFEAVPGPPAGMRNVVGHLPGRAPALLVGAHYDTKDIPGFVGANDGASGTAVVVELSRALATGRRACAREVRFVLFDGEESPDDARDFYSTGLRGSRAYAARHAREIGSVVIVDFVAHHGARVRREAGSHPALWSRLRASAARVGVGAMFPGGTVGEVLDDHTPFARAGVPSIDLIDTTFRHWHRTGDNLRAISPAGLDAAGETLVDLLRREANRTCR